jgi:hypothetical protein
MTRKRVSWNAAAALTFLLKLALARPASIH